MKKILRINGTLQQVTDAINYKDRKQHVRTTGCFYFVSGIRVSISNYKIEGQTRIYLSHRNDRTDYGMLDNVLKNILIKLNENEMSYILK